MIVLLPLQQQMVTREIFSHSVVVVVGVMQWKQWLLQWVSLGLRVMRMLTNE